jgi:cytochrome P450
MTQSPLRSPPGVSRLRAALETARLLDNAVEVLLQHAIRLGGAFYYYFGGVKRVLVVSDPLMLRHVLKDNAGNYRKSDIQVERIGEFGGEALVTNHGEEWLRKRRLMQRAFRPDKLSSMIPDMHSTLDEVLVEFERKTRAGPVDLGAEMVRITLAIIMRSLFSVRLAPEDEFVISGGITAIQAFMVRQIVHPYLKKWFALSGELAKHHEMRAQGDRILERMVERRRSQSAPNDDFLQLLLEAGSDDICCRFTAQQILNESMHMLMAGHETSSNGLTWLLHLLSLHPNWLAQVRSELCSVVGSEPLSARHLTDLPLTTAAIEEAMRLFPPFWMIDRTAIEDDDACGFAIPAGTTVVAFIYGAHHDPKRWSHPESFAPNRFGGKANESRSGFDYLPFGAGPRSCIGFNYAMIQMTVILSAILAKYRFEAVDPGPVRPRAMITLRPRDGIRMRFECLAETGRR